MYFILEGEVEINVDLRKNSLTDKDLKMLEQDLELNKHESTALTQERVRAISYQDMSQLSFGGRLLAHLLTKNTLGNVRDTDSN